VIVAGGGGGAGLAPNSSEPGGGGGGTSGESGQNTCGGGGGTQSAGGAGVGLGASGSLGTGGRSFSYNSEAGGGGGSGFYGGGGGDGGFVCAAEGGGGGGSGHFGPGTSNTSFGTDATGVPSITFTYTGSPTVSLTAPADGATYSLHQTVPASYTCAPGVGTTLGSCSGTVPSGVAVDTSAPGQHSFSVSATDSDSGHATVSATYTVLAAPTLSAVGESSGAWSLPKGTTFIYTLDHPAQVTLTFTRHTTGRKMKSKCVRQTRTNRHKHQCSLSVAAGTFTTTGQAGPNTLTYSGAIAGGRTLKPGSDTVSITATDTAGNTSSAQTLRFTLRP
jgi:hypothetical protein